MQERLKEYEVLAEQTQVYDTDIGEGNSAVLDSFKRSMLEKSKMVLAQDPKNGPARRIAKRAVRQDSHKPDFHSLTVVGQQVGTDEYKLG